jgi:hypothetical protein
LTLRIAYLVLLIFLSLGAFFLISPNPGINEVYLSILRWVYLPTYVLIAPALVQLGRGQKVSAALLVISRILAAIMILGLLILGFGFVEDLFGTHCTGFFGATTSCVSDKYLWVSLAGLHPYILLPLLGLTFLVSAKGWFDYFYYEERK